MFHYHHCDETATGLLLLPFFFFHHPIIRAGKVYLFGYAFLACAYVCLSTFSRERVDLHPWAGAPGHVRV